MIAGKYGDERNAAVPEGRRRFGPASKLDDLRCTDLIKALKAGVIAAGFTSELWTLI